MSEKFVIDITEDIDGEPFIEICGTVGYKWRIGLGYDNGVPFFTLLTTDKLGHSQVVENGTIPKEIFSSFIEHYKKKVDTP